MIPPLDFIPQAEASGAIVPIGRWVLATACRQAAEWLRAYPDLAPATVNVNVSPRQLLEPSFVDDVALALADCGLPPQRLTVEVTETAINDHVTAGAHLRAARALGVRVALDDFGTGQSTLSILDSVPIDQLKLDRSFVPSLGGRPSRWRWPGSPSPWVPSWWPRHREPGQVDHCTHSVTAWPKASTSAARCPVRASPTCSPPGRRPRNRLADLGRVIASMPDISRSMPKA